jgi:hypothetical protein
MKSICLITCYMGPLPGYFAYYTASCKKNKTIDFMVINDHIAESYSDGNIDFVKMNITELNAFSGEQLKAPIQLSSAWKINELKPLFGEIFSKELNRYDHWGWCDLDIIWGDLRKFLNDELLNEYDVITTKEYWTAGHFTLFKNKPFINALYKRYDDIIALLNNPTYFAFEECCHRWNGEIFTFEALKKKGLPPAMFDIVKHAERHGELKAHFKDIIREHPQPVNYIYKHGALTDLATHEEFMYYHLITVKKIWRFYIPEYKKMPDSLIMSPYGIRGTNDPKLFWFTKRVYACYKGIRKSAKKQKTAELIKKLFR